MHVLTIYINDEVHLKVECETHKDCEEFWFEEFEQFDEETQNNMSYDIEIA